ncbi:MAG TPA: dihydropteroate synthase [Pyrinomonadaceae bacterium]|nr:dihydropteroate synthase [Pyrinomonadaceae bacterium]
MEKTEKIWKTSQRKFDYGEKTLVMAILNVTPDSFSDGGKFFAIDEALRQAEKVISEGADILDIGGESTRPNAARVETEEEIRRTSPVIEAIKKRFDIAISIDTSKAKVAESAVNSGAEIINDISGLRFDERIAEVAAKYQTGLVLMHLRGDFETMHEKQNSADIIAEVSDGFRLSIEKARSFGVKNEAVALDIGIGFSKTFEQNLQLLARLKDICDEFSNFPMLVGVSRKSFIGKILNDAPTEERLNGTMAANSVAVWNGAKIIRVHDVKANVEMLKTVEAIKRNFI